MTFLRDFSGFLFVMAGMDKLAEIMAWKAREIETIARKVTERELHGLAEQSALRPSFSGFLRRENRLAVIAEIKRRSPSAGEIAPGISALDRARAYTAGGADALSVLTDERYFGGRLTDLEEITRGLAAGESAVPCLRKDFMLHPIQVVEAARAGASAILIIVRALDDDRIQRLYEAASLAGLDSLFEVHEEREVERALRFEPGILGVNNRDLSRFRTDLSFSESILPQLPEGIIKVSESGIFTGDDAARVRRAGADAILVGEALMRSEDPDSLIAAFHFC